MDSLPRLSGKDIEAELDAVYERRRELGRASPRHLFAIYGTGTDERRPCTVAGTFDVVPVRSELELRERMPPVDARDQRIAFLVPFTRDVPLDLAGRFHRNGRVIRIGPDAQIRRLFGVADLDDAVRMSPLVSMLLSAANVDPIPAGVAKLDVDTMWAAWLTRVHGVPATGGVLGREALLAWAAEDARGATFLSDVSERRRGEVETALLDHLGQRLGPAAPVIFRAWRAGRGRDALEIAFLCETLASREDSVVKLFLRERFRALPGVPDAQTIDVARALGATAGGALRLLESRGLPETHIRAILRDADRRVDLPEIRPFLEEDVRLPVGWTARLARVGETLTNGAKAPSADAVRDAATALRALESHRSFREPESLDLVHRAEMAVRLLGWLADRGDQRIPAPDTSIGDLEILGRWYAEEGGYVDWARHACRGAGTDTLGRGVLAVVQAADDVRLELDRRFARSLKSYVDARRQSSTVLPLDRASERFGARFLKDRDDRRLVVLLADGMAWAQAAELLVDLEEHHVGPIAWNWTKKGRVGEGAAAVHNVVLATLPTITEVSRSAFFEGALIPPGKENDANRDDERFRRNKALLQFFAGTETPTLLLRAEVSAEVGHASEAAKRAVADKTTRVVGVVLNAIDASLKGDPQTRIRWTASTIRPLLPILDAAREAGRTVLLVADHGHVPSDCFGPGVRTAGGGGARWRPWKGPDDPVADWELVFDGEGVWKPRGAEGVALITDDRHRYGGSVHAGEHGGATLAEVVVPCLLLGFDEPSSALDDDRDRNVKAFHRPPFWRFEVRDSTPREPVKKDRGQLPLLSAVPVAAEAAGPPAKTPSRPPREPEAEPALDPLAAALRESQLLRAMATPLAPLERIVRAVSFLASRGGLVSEEAFAAEMREPVRRVGQLVSVLSEPLNVDSFPILAHDRQTKEVRLDRELLVQQFALRKEDLSR